MLPKRFDQARPFATLGVVLLVWLLLPVVFKTFARSTFFEIQAPITIADSFVADVQNFWATKLHTQAELRAAGALQIIPNLSHADLSALLGT